jgi:hypothetical protein
MKILRVLLGLILGVAVLGVLAAGGYWGFKLVMDLLAVLWAEAGVITVLALTMTFLCAVMIYRGFARVGQKDVRAYRHIEKAHLYEKILLLWGAKLKTQPTSIDPSLEEELHQLVQLLTLRGNPKVIKTYLKLHASERSAGLHSPDIPSQFGRLQLEMRRDLGLSTQNLNAEDLMQLFVAEVKSAAEPSKALQRQDIQPRVSLAANA